MTFWLIGMALGVFLSLNLLGLAASYIAISSQPTALRIQQRQVARATLNSRLPLIGLNIAIVCALTATSVYLARDWFVFDRPVWWVLLLQVLFVSMTDDFFFYLLHRWWHNNPTLYRRIHKIHHKAHTPVPIEYIYVHPLEWFMGLTGVVIGFVTLTLVDGGLSVWTFLAYSLLRQLHELHIHSGLKSTLGQWLPLWGTTEHHDQHHAKPTLGNYASTYTLWDRVLKTRVVS